MHFKVPFAAAPPQAGQIQDSLLQYAEQGVVGLRAGTVELVVDQSVPVGASRGEAIIHPQGIHVLFRLHHGMDVVVDQLRLAVTGVLADQVRAAKLVIPVDERDRAAELGCHVEGQRRFSRSRRTGKMYGISDFQVRERPIGQSLDLRAGDKLIAGLNQHIVSLRLHSDNYSAVIVALCIHLRNAPLFTGLLAAGIIASSIF